MSRYDLGSAMPASEGVQAEGIVKWFNGVKGFGFVAINNNAQDAFLHISVVTRAGLQGLAENTRLRCMVAPSQRGMQVTHIIEVLGVDENAPQQHSAGGHGNSGHGGGYRQRDDFAPRDSSYGRESHGRVDFGGGGGRNDRGPRESSGPEVEITGSIKWFKPDKGFGFAMPDDGGKDVFIHRSALERLGMNNIETGRKIRMMVTTSQKGREASRIEVLD